MMEKAIEVMKQSINEPRSDGKPSPLVGAVLVKPDGTMDTACRGELRHGDHAEFTLLERKHRQERLDGSFLFATLEPCAPGARKHPKLACAERIVNARIAEVWVGIEDPDPTVDRQGIRYLEENGIKVHLFDRDLQEQIREANEKFIAEALKRAAGARNLKASQTFGAFEVGRGAGRREGGRPGLRRSGTLSRTNEDFGQDDFRRIPSAFGAAGIAPTPRLEAGADRIWLSAFWQGPARGSAPCRVERDD